MKKFIPALALPFLLISCGGNNDTTVKQLSDFKEASTADSLMYYVGQQRAAEYWREANNDTTLKSRESRDEFMRGVRAGLDAVRDNDAYNQGVFVGIQLAMNLKEIQKGYDIKPDRKIMLDAMADGLKNDSVVNIGDANKGFQNVMEGLNRKKEEADKEFGRQALASEAKALKMTEVNKDLYASSPTLPGYGPQIKVGDNVAVVMTVSVVGGEIIDERAHHSFPVGSSLPGPVTEALLSMKLGEKRDFLTTAPALMGRFYLRRGLEPGDLLKLEIKVDSVGTIAAPVIK